MSKITILAADSIDSCRYALESFILQNPNQFKLLYTAAHAQEVVEITKKHSPQIVVVDVDLPGMCSIELCQRLVQHSADSRIIVRASDDVVYHTRQVLKAGANGVLLRHAPQAEMVHCFNTVSQGHFHVPGQCRHLLRHKFDEGRELGHFEQQVLWHLCLRKTLEEIVEVLYASLSRVKRAKERINSLAGTHDSSGILKWAWLQGYVSLKECWGL
jgi:DNA-binding NarL/FixJ family response regulator